MRRWKSRIIDNLKTLVQILIPVLSLTIAILALSIKFRSMQEDNNEQMEIIVARVDSLEIKFNKLIKDTIK